MSELPTWSLADPGCPEVFVVDQGTEIDQHIIDTEQKFIEEGCFTSEDVAKASELCKAMSELTKEAPKKCSSLKAWFKV